MSEEDHLATDIALGRVLFEADETGNVWIMSANPEVPWISPEMVDAGLRALHENYDMDLVDTHRDAINEVYATMWRIMVKQLSGSETLPH